MGERTYLSKVEVRFPIVLKTDSSEYIKSEVKENMIDAVRVNFLLGRETMKEWKEFMIDYSEDVVVFKDKKVRQRRTGEENLIDYLEMVGEEENKDEIDLEEKENEVKSDDEIHSVIEQENDKRKIQEKWVRT